MTTHDRSSQERASARRRRLVMHSCLLLAAVIFAGLLLRGMSEVPLPNGAIARVDGVLFDRADLAEYLGFDPEFDDLASARRAVDRFVGDQVLRLGAAARGEAVEGLLERLVDEAGGPAEVTDEDVRARYQRDFALYNRDREARLAYAVVPIARDGETSDSRSALRNLAERISLRARLHPGRTELPLWIPRGETRAFVLESGPWSCESAGSDGESEEPGTRPPAEVLRAACGLREGRLTPIIETETGFYVAKLRRKSRAWRIPLVRVEREIRADLERERLESARRRESQRLVELARVAVSPQAIAELVTPSAPATTTPGRSGPPLPPGHLGDA